MTSDNISKANKKNIDYDLILRWPFIFSIALSILVSIYVIINTDTTPATYDDYATLNEKLLAIQEDHSSFFKQGGILEVSEDGIYYTVENSQCQMTGEYDSDYKLINKTEKDKYTPLALVIIQHILYAFIFIFCFNGICLIIIVAILPTPPGETIEKGE